MKNKDLAAKIISLLLSVLIVAAIMPNLACEVFANQSAIEDLAELSKQLSDEDADPFAYGIENRGFRLQAAGDYPESFDLRNADFDGDGVTESYVTAVKFQNPFGSCWGFAAISSAETSILTSGLTSAGADDFDLSEKHLVYFLNQQVEDQDPADPHNQNGEGMIYNGDSMTSALLNTGGVPFYATGLFASGTGPVLEDREELEYHGREKKVTGSDGKTYQSEEAARSAGVEPYCYSADDDWSVDSSQRWRQSYVLSESFLLPTPAGKDGYERDFAISAIKEQLYNGRAVEIGFTSDTYRPIQGTTKKSKYINTDNWAHYTYDDNTDSNHGVSIIGWDDNYPKENFVHDDTGASATGEGATPAPEHNGAWLVKNSWGSVENEFPNRGPGWGIDGAGYFWLSYDDKGVQMVEALAFDKANTSEGYYLCEYDFMPVNGVSAAYTASKLSMANVFIAEGDGSIESVSCQTTAPGTEVLYDVYLLGDDAKNPTDGELVAQTFEEYKYGGFHKANLYEPVFVKKGQKFSVVVTQTTPDRKYAFSIQMGRNKAFADWYESVTGEKLPSYAHSVINAGESLFGSGDDWFDLSDPEVKKSLLIPGFQDYLDLDNFPIKAYMAKAAPPEYSITYKLNGGIYKGSSDDIVEQYIEDTVIDIHEAPTREDYKFLYWKGSEYQPGEDYTVTEDHTFVAQWEKIEDETSDEGTSGNGRSSANGSGNSKSSGTGGVKSGDSSHLILWIALMGMSVVAVSGGTILSKRKQNKSLDNSDRNT